MTNDSSPLHSGSRWEPVAGPTEHLSAVPPQILGSESAPDHDPEAKKRRRRRGPVLAAFAAILTLGASTAGMAYVRAAEPGAGDPAAPPVSRTVDGRTDGVPGDGALAEGDRGAGDREARDRGAGDRARAHDHRDDRDDHGRGDDHSSADRDEDGQPS